MESISYFNINWIIDTKVKRSETIWFFLYFFINNYILLVYVLDFLMMFENYNYLLSAIIRNTILI